MKMFNFKIMILIMTYFGFPQILLAQSGGGSTGIGSGGVGFVCRDLNGKIEKAYLLDFAEAASRGRIINSNVSLKKVISKVRSTSLQKRIMKEYDHVLRAIDRVDTHFSLPNPEDYTALVKMDGCELETIGLYDDVRNELRVNSEIFEKLPVEHQEGFYAHEVIYKLARKYEVKNSNAVRRFIGELFSENGELNSLNNDELLFLSKASLTNCEFYIESIEIEDQSSEVFGSRSIKFIINTEALGENLESIGYLYTQYTGQQTVQMTKIATKLSKNHWIISVSIPKMYNPSYLDLAFFATTKQQNTFWINKDNLPWKNFTIDLQTFYLLDGYARDLSGNESPRKIKSVARASAEFVKQFQPILCEKEN